MAEVTMPRLSDSMEEGTIIEWLKSDGEQVERGEELLMIETDKAQMPYDADTSGVLQILVGAGETVAIGERIAMILDASELTANGSPAPVVAAAGARPVADGISASPIARRAAAALGIQLEDVAGSGPRGRVIKADVVQASLAAAALPAEPEVVPTPAADFATTASGPGGLGAKENVETTPLTRTQQTVARRMAESKATAPDFTVSVDVDMTEALAFRERLKQLPPPIPTLNDMIVRAVAVTLSRHPKVNSAYRGDSIDTFPNVNIGIAVATDDALMVPVLKNAAGLALSTIAARTRSLIERTRKCSITPPELSGATFTVSNLGMFGVDAFAGIINPPQAAILCVGATSPRPGVSPEGDLAIRQIATITLVSDHRVLYGADAARFLADLRQLLEHPLELVV